MAVVIIVLMEAGGAVTTIFGSFHSRLVNEVGEWAEGDGQLGVE
jgi:hypothetical protein